MRWKTRCTQLIHNHRLLISSIDCSIAFSISWFLYAWWIVGDVVHCFKSGYQTDIASPYTMLTDSLIIPSDDKVQLCSSGNFVRLILLYQFNDLCPFREHIWQITDFDSFPFPVLTTGSVLMLLLIGLYNAFNAAFLSCLISNSNSIVFNIQNVTLSDRVATFCINGSNSSPSHQRQQHQIVIWNHITNNR